MNPFKEIDGTKVGPWRTAGETAAKDSKSKAFSLNCVNLATLVEARAEVDKVLELSPHHPAPSLVQGTLFRRPRAGLIL